MIRHSLVAGLVAGLLLAPAPSRAEGKKGPAAAADDEGGEQGEGGADAQSKVFERAMKLFENEDYYSASIELDKVIQGQTGDGAEVKQRAEFWMGKTLYELKFYSAALSYFDQILEKGPEHRYYGATLKWLAALTKKLPDTGILERIGKFTRDDLEKPELAEVRDELIYLLGRHHYNQGKFKEAIDLFGSIPVESPFFVKAKFLEGITHVRDYDAKSAAESFRQILRVTTARKDKQPDYLEFDELASISLARVFYSVGQFNTSVKYFDKIPQSSPDWLNSLFESSWSYFMMDHHSKALGNIHTLNAPFFENEFFPESYILKAVVYFKRCLYDRSAETLAEFNAEYPPLKVELERMLDRYKNPVEFFGYAQKIQKGTATLPERIGRLAVASLNDRQLRKRFDYVDELDRELKQVERAEPAWKSTAVAARVLEDLAVQKSLAENEAGNLARQRVQRVVDEIQELVKQAIKIEFETLNAQKGQLEAQLRNEQVVPANVQAEREVAVDDEHQFWPFTGEYWKDELGAYRFRVPSKCSR